VGAVSPGHGLRLAAMPGSRCLGEGCVVHLIKQTKGKVMTSMTPCYRHSRRGLWMAACADCTSWHLAEEVARRDKVVAVTARTDSRRQSRPERTCVQFPLRLVA
jgi:hypothetical protein